MKIKIKGLKGNINFSNETEKYRFLAELSVRHNKYGMRYELEVDGKEV